MRTPIIALLCALWAAGTAQAQVRMGLLYYHGHAVKEDDAAAFAWFARASRQGNADAQYHLANMYNYGLGLPPGEKDPDRSAAQWYFESARQGHADAQYVLAILFLTGKGVERSEAEAAKWMKRAAQGGHPQAREFEQALR